MRDKLAIDVQQEGGSVKALFKGSLDEDADYSRIKFTDVTQARYNLREVTLINSVGIQKWIKFMKTRPASVELSLEKCSVAFVLQLNNFASFLGDGQSKIHSIMAPYFCGECDDNRDVELVIGEDVMPGVVPEEAPSKNCPECKSVMEFDDIETAFFVFLENPKWS